MASDLNYFKLCSIVLFSAILCASAAVLSDNHENNYDYYKYTLDRVSSSRSKRYVENVISRLADNYASDAGGYPQTSHHDKDAGFGRQSRMEIVGNVAVPAVPYPSHSFDLTAQSQVQGDSRAAQSSVDPHSTSNSSPHDSSPQVLTGSTVLSPHPDNTEVPSKTPKLSKKIEDSRKILSDKKFEGPKTSDSKDKGGTEIHGVPHLVPELTTQRVVSSTHHDEDDDYVNSGEFPQEITNNTLEKNNITGRQEDHHIYYNSTFISDSKVGHDFWVDLHNEPNVVVNEMLSTSHRRAATVKLSFDFPFYGHLVRNMTIATGGFLYTGDYIHSWLAATQYIAPLMANFDTSLSNYSHVKYRDNGTALTVEWERVSLQDRRDAGEFSFQVTLHKSGDIVFVYRQIPLLVDQIEDSHHPVKVGLSDAYIIDKTIFYVRRKTIYEYHRVNFKRDEIRNWTVIYLSALPTCMDLTDCTSCLTTKINFECSWCESVGRCSSGFDRKRQEWTSNQCELTSVSDDGECSSLPKARPMIIPRHEHLPHISNHYDGNSDSEGSGVQMSSILGLFLVVALVSGMAMWLLYAYRNPHTPSGQLLIKYRPSQWSLRRGEARYTAASIHM